jgi:hypothetical protein
VAKILVDQAEWDALRDLRDGEYERVRVRALQFEEHYKGALSVNKDQVMRLTTQGLQLDNARRKIAALERELHRVRGELEQYKPLTSSIEQPLFAAPRKR